ncbi:hypothetical protein V5O48_012335 [Marasmius crinis-equi]|uniref:Isopenicillin N synthase-like Fe(2+) 2OG dioxygenase domain-containing protein n=1 Tax=Marasmius crinis-equi TaxID=585013 RepID=A0ABR3F3C7_9AGAR
MSGNVVDTVELASNKSLKRSSTLRSWLLFEKANSPTPRSPSTSVMRRLWHALASRISRHLKKTLPVFATSHCRTSRAFQMERLLPALSIDMGLLVGLFNKYHKNGKNQFRLLHHPEGPAKVFESGEKGRIGAHTDFGTCTILLQDDVVGLEVEPLNQPGVFIPAPPIRGTAVFNIGDFLKRRSNVLGIDTKIIADCVPDCWGPDKPKKYPPINAAEYTDMKMNLTYLRRTSYVS